MFNCCPQGGLYEVRSNAIGIVSVVIVRVTVVVDIAEIVRVVVVRRGLTNVALSLYGHGRCTEIHPN